MKVLFYTRPKTREFMYSLASAWGLSEENCRFTSDYRDLEPSELPDRFYQYYNKNQKDNSLNAEEIQRVIRRCRYLRSLPFSKALRVANAMALAIGDELEKFSPDVSFGLTMDSYVLDLFDRKSRQRGIEYLGVLPCPINGHMRLTCRGELRSYRTPDQNEIQSKTKDFLKDTYVPSFCEDYFKSNGMNIGDISGLFLSRYIREKAKTVYFNAKKIIARDPLNFHFNSSLDDGNMRCSSLGHIFASRHGSVDWLEKIQKEKSSGKTIIFYPLQFYPECSIDYWNTEIELLDFYGALQRVLEMASRQKDIYLVIKEHPVAVGLRDPKIYQLIERNPNTLLVPHNINTHHLTNQSDAILTWTGTVGLESACRGKPVFTLGHAFYDTVGAEAFTQIKTLNEISQIPEKLKNWNKSKDEQVSVRLIENLLKSTIPFYVYPVNCKEDPSSVYFQGLALGLKELIQASSKNNYLRNGSL